MLFLPKCSGLTFLFVCVCASYFQVIPCNRGLKPNESGRHNKVVHLREVDALWPPMKAFLYGMAAAPLEALAAESDCWEDADLAADAERACAGLPARLPKASRGAVAPLTGLQCMYFCLT